MTKKFGPWIVWGKAERPPLLRDDQIIEVVCHDDDGTIKEGLSERPVVAHAWRSVPTLAYRVELQEVTRVAYGTPGCMFGIRDTDDTHKITYTMLGDEVVSCVMEKL